MARRRKKGALSRCRAVTHAAGAFRRSGAVARRKKGAVVGRTDGGGGGGGEDRISELPEDLLLLVLRRLDTRSALSITALSRRWARLRRDLDVLPPRYHRLLNLRQVAINDDDDANAIAGRMRRYERLAMRNMAASINSLLDFDRVSGDTNSTRKINRIKVEFYASHQSDCINRLIAKAVDFWGVKDLEVVVGPPTYLYSTVDHFHKFLHNFPRHGLCNYPHNSTLTSLKLVMCVIPPLQGFQALTTLVLICLPSSLPPSAYESVFTSCPQLQVLHLKFCNWEDMIDVNAPCSSIKQLVFYHCRCLVNLQSLPKLEELYIVQTSIWFGHGSMPNLTRLNLNLRYEHGDPQVMFILPWYLNLEQIAEYTPRITELDHVVAA